MSSFDVAAESYDRFMGRYSNQLSAQLADLAGVTAGQRVLDVGSGPGALTAELVQRVGAEHVSAADPSEQFVEAARSRHPGVDVRLASAEDLPYGDDEFDAAIAQLVVHFMSDPVKGISEMARVTRPGGVVAACVWDLAGGRAPISPFWKAVHALDAEAEDESLYSGARQGHLVELFREAGLHEIQETEIVSASDYESFDEWWRPYTLGVGPAGKYVAALDEGQQAAVRDSCRSLLPEAPFSQTAWAWAVRGAV